MNILEYHMDYTGPYLSNISLFVLVLNDIDFRSYVGNATTDCNKRTVYVVTVSLIDSTKVIFQWFLDKQIEGNIDVIDIQQ